MSEEILIDAWEAGLRLWKKGSGCSYTQVCRWLREGVLYGYKHGRRWRVRVADVEAFWAAPDCPARARGYRPK